MDLNKAELGREYRVKSILTPDRELNGFLFTLGLFSGEPVTVISRRRRGCTVAIKDSRYHIDDRLASAITVEC